MSAKQRSPGKPASNWAIGAVADAIKKIEEGTQKKYLEELKGRLELLEKTFVNPALNPKSKSLYWPKEEDFRALDKCIFGLARGLRRKKLLTHNEAIILVDRKWPSLGLEQRLLCFMRAALGQQRTAPKTPKAVAHLNGIFDLAKKESKKGRLAQLFVRDYRLLARKERKLSEIKWGDYEDILLRKDGQRVFLQCGMDFLSPGMNCCVMYLEMQRDWWLWHNELGAWETAEFERTPFFEWIERNDVADSQLDETHLKRQRESWKERQRRARERKWAKKRDTSELSPAANGPPQGNLRDAWLMTPAKKVR